MMMIKIMMIMMRMMMMMMILIMMTMTVMMTKAFQTNEKLIDHLWAPNLHFLTTEK